MNWDEFIEKFNSHCIGCQNLLCESWCIVHGGRDGSNPQKAISECEKDDFRAFVPNHE